MRVLFLALFTLGCSLQEIQPTNRCTTRENTNDHHNDLKLQELVSRYADQGLPGLSVYISGPTTTWTGTSGYSQLESKTPMKPCHLFASASIGKLYCAVAILKMHELGILSIEDKVSKHLGEAFVAKIADKNLRIHHLLSHTGGLASVDENIKFVTQILRNPKEVTPSFIDRLIATSPYLFHPGEKFSYSSSGFEILTRIMDRVLRYDHSLFYKQMFEDLGLANTYYRSRSEIKDQAVEVNYYLDRFDKLFLENITLTNNYLTDALSGSDGIIASPSDHVHFLRQILLGTYLNSHSKTLLVSKVATDYSPKPSYGKGLWFKETAFGLAIGHDGGSIGAGADLWYFPEQDVVVFSATNVGIFFTDSKLATTYRQEFLPELFKLALHP